MKSVHYENRLHNFIGLYLHAQFVRFFGVIILSFSKIYLLSFNIEFL